MSKNLAKRKIVSTFAAERWQSGRLRRSWKPLNWEVPGVRIPLFPQNQNEARRCRRISTSFCFVTLRHANLFVGRSGMKTKVVDLSTPCGVRILQGAPRRAKGKTSRHEVSTKSIPLFPQELKRQSLICRFFCLWASSVVFFVPCSLFYNGIYFHFKAKIPIFVVTTQTINQN